MLTIVLYIPVWETFRQEWLDENQWLWQKYRILIVSNSAYDLNFELPSQISYQHLSREFGIRDALRNVLEHIHNDSHAIDELKRLLKKKGSLHISTPFLYRYHQAPKDYKRYTLEYFEKILKNKKFKIKKKISLGTGPFLASYSLLFDYLIKIPLIIYPVITICFLLDYFLALFHKNKTNIIYPICVVIVAEK